MSTTTLQINEALKSALDEVTKARELWEQEVANKRQWFADYEQSLHEMIGMPNGNGNGNGGILARHTSSEQQKPELNGRVLSVGDDKVAMVRHYLQKHGGVRQAQISKDLGINSGTVSVALQVLHMASEVTPGDKVDGSRVWEPVSVPVGSNA